MNELKVEENITNEETFVEISEEVEFRREKADSIIIIETIGEGEVTYRKVDETIGKKEALIGGLVGTVVSATLGFAGGVYYERRKRNALYKVLDELITKEEVEIQQQLDEGLVDEMITDIKEQLNNTKLSTKETVKWNELLNRFIRVSATKALVNQQQVIIDKIEEQNKEDK